MGRLAHTGWVGVKRVRVDATDCPVAHERLRKLKEAERRLVGEWGADAVCRIQVDGGSEFMGEFERACMQLGIELLVLPARRPQWNGLVERINRTVRTECWNHYRGEWNCRDMNERMDEYIRFYNDERPHHSLGMKTPAETATMTGVSA